MINDPVRLSLAVASGGTSEIIRKLPVVGNIYSKGVSLASEGYKVAANVYTGGAYNLVTGLGTSLFAPKSMPSGDYQSDSWQGGAENTMAQFNVGGFLGNLGSIFGGSSNPYLSTIGNVGQLSSNFFPQQVAMRPPSPPMAGAGTGPGPMSRLPALRSPGAIVARGFFNKFPNLSNSIQQLRDRGIKTKRSQLFSLMKRFGPEVLVTGGLLTAASVSELMMAGPGRRRMNPGNVTALRRSMRRLESFHKLCQTSDKLRKPRARSCKK